jgi:hypothetical protein
MIIGPLDRGIRKVRVWQNEMPYTIAPGEILRTSISPTGTPSIDYEISVAVEMSLFASPRLQYGLLGANYKPEKSGDLLISVFVSESLENPFTESIAWKRDRVFWGLLKEYALAVLKIVTSSPVAIGPGTLDFRCAAHAEIGSNQVLFACLAQTLMSTFADGLNGEEIADVAFRQSIKESGVLLA